MYVSCSLLVFRLIWDVGFSPIGLSLHDPISVPHSSLDVVGDDLVLD